jgi:hypothetical protein
LLLLPLIFGIAPTLTAVLAAAAVGAAVSAAGQAVSAYEKSRRAQRPRIKQDGAAESIGSFRDIVYHDMSRETRRNAEVSARIDRELERGRQEALRVLDGGDPEKYREHLGRVQSSRGEIAKEIASIQSEFAAGYEARIAKSMESVRDSVARRQEVYMGELRAVKDAGAEKRKRAGELAAVYLKEAKSLIGSLRDDFAGEALGGVRLAALVSQVDEASAQYGAGRYEAAIAVAKDAAVSAIEEIYKADARRQEWDNYHKTALTLAAEIEAYLKAQETVTPEIKAEAERRSGRKLEDEIVGMKVGDYTCAGAGGKAEDGLTPFGRLAEAVSEQKRELEEAAPSSVSVTRMKEIVSALNTKLYPAAMTVVYEGIMNMNNAFARQRLSEDIVDFFEEHNFTFSGYRYDGDRHDGALRIGLENEVTGEEIVVTLAPELMGAGDVQTRVSIDQLRGDERNEERKEYYRQAVREVVAEGIPGAALDLSCDESTRNKLSPNAQLREKLKK